MPFSPPSWVPPLPDVPDSISLERFMLGRSFTALEMKERVDHLSQALCKELGFSPDEGSEWDKVVAVFSLNSIDYITLALAMHRIGGILTCVNAAYNAMELEYQLKDSGARALFTCLPLMETALVGAQAAKLPRDNIFFMPLPDQVQSNMSPEMNPPKALESLVQAGAKLPSISPSDAAWSKGEGARRTAFLCYSSGTSGVPKGVMISHKNVIANVLQNVTFERRDREQLEQKSGNKNFTEYCLGLLPQSHIYGLILISLVGPFRGDGVVILPKYDFEWLLDSIQRYKISLLYLVPPIVIHMTNRKDACQKYDLSSVRALFTGAAPLGRETAEVVNKMYPRWAIRQGYGLTETATVVSSTASHDIWLGSSGSLLPGMRIRLVTAEGNEIIGHDQPGELWVHSPSVSLGYLHRPDATRETFVDERDGRYMGTGDEAVVSRSASGHEHILIVDRIKELIKVKGMQVAPAELEAHLLSHPMVSDCVVIGVPSAREGEVPKAFVVKAAGSIEESDAVAKRQIKKYVEQHKSQHKWLKGGVEFIDAVPKSPSGKILRRLIRDREREKMRKEGAKL